MNIFNAITLGNGQFQEPNFTSIIGYFLDASQDHGLSHAFLEEFLELIGEEKFDINFDYRVNIESRYKSRKMRTNVLDLEIEIYNNKGLPEKIIIIELKIKESSVKENQLVNQYDIVKRKKPKIKINYIYLTPFKDVQESKYDVAYKNIKEKIENENEHNDKVKHIYYVHSDEKKPSISTCFRKVLKKESVGKICPIQEYTKHTIKGLIHFFETTLLDDFSDAWIAGGPDQWTDGENHVSIDEASAKYQYQRQNYLIQTGMCQRENNTGPTKLSRILLETEGEYDRVLVGKVLRNYYIKFMEDLLTQIDPNQENNQEEVKELYDYIEKHINKYYGYHREDGKSQGSTHDLARYFVDAKNRFDEWCDEPIN